MQRLQDFLTSEVKEELKEAIQENHFAWIGDVGFFTWLEIVKEGKLYIYIGNLWVEPSARGKTPLFWIRKFLKDKYPNLVFGYWHRDKDNKFFYTDRRKK